MDIAEFLTARENEREQAALAASPGPWHANAEGDEVWAVDDIAVCDGFALSNRQLRATVDHVVRHDPEWVLADVAAKRAVMAEHYAPFVLGEQRRHCMGCGFTAEEELRTPEINRCPTLIALASVYANHPEFDPAWRPLDVTAHGLLRDRR